MFSFPCLPQRGGGAYIDVGAARKRLKSLAPDRSDLTDVAGVANCISLVTTAIDVLEPGDERFPERLVALGWRRRLHVRGTLNAGPAVAIVGARAASRTALDRAHALARHLA